MSTNIKVLPFRNDWDFSHSLLEMIETGGFDADAFSDVPSTAVPPEFNSYAALLGDTCGDENHHDAVAYGLTLYDAFGDPLRCVSVRDFVAVWDSQRNERWVTNALPANRAAIAYLRVLPVHWMVALYWH